MEQLIYEQNAKYLNSLSDKMFWVKNMKFKPVDCFVP